MFKLFPVPTKNITAPLIALLVSLPLGLSWFATTSDASAQDGPHKITVEKGDFGERTTTVYPDGTSKVVTKDNNSRIIEEHRRKDGTLSYEKTTFHDGGYREDFYDATGKTETGAQMYRADGTLNWHESVLPSGATVNLSYYPDGKTVRFQSTHFNREMHTYVRFRKDGKTPWWFKSDINDEKQVKVFFDTKGDPTERQFTVHDLAKGGFSIGQGDGPKEFSQHLYRDKSLTPTYRQTWSVMWPKDFKESIPTLTAVEVFTPDGKRVDKKLIFEPTQKGTPVLKHCLQYQKDGSYIKRSFDDNGKRVKEVDCTADGKELSARSYDARDRHEEQIDKKWIEGFATPWSRVGGTGGDI